MMGTGKVTHLRAHFRHDHFGCGAGHARVVPASRAVNIARPETPMISEATEASVMLASSKPGQVPQFPPGYRRNETRISSMGEIDSGASVTA